ncbi:hypothetical protein ACEN2I_03275 [Flavobacterium sp. W22_SRS_FK3]
MKTNFLLIGTCIIFDSFMNYNSDEKTNKEIITATSKKDSISIGKDLKK